MAIDQPTVREKWHITVKAQESQPQSEELNKSSKLQEMSPPSGEQEVTNLDRTTSRINNDSDETLASVNDAPGKHGHPNLKDENKSDTTPYVTPSNSADAHAESDERHPDEGDAGMSPLHPRLPSHSQRPSQVSFAGTVRQDYGASDKEKGGGNFVTPRPGQGDSPDGGLPKRPGLLERTTSGHTRGKQREDGKVELLEKDCYSELGFSYSSTKKWTILSVSVLAI
jgi:hypothetical protein